VRDVRLEQLDGGDWAESAGGVWADPEALLAHLRDNTNHVDAAARMDWRAVCPDGARVLDLGCGAGWLTGMLTREPYVANVLAWDSSPRLVRELLPATVELVEGDMGKVERVCGEFVPLVLADDSVDLVVMSSAFHHAERPRELLGELRRVLVPGGSLVLLNETPWSRAAMLSFSVRTVGAALFNLVGARSRFERPGHLASDHALYDPELGDRAMTLPQWRALAEQCGWALRCIDSGLPPYRPHYRSRGRLEPNLTHFVLQPRARP
jgi:SAM-dependent methyltransferase